MNIQKMAAAKNKVIIGRVESVEPYRNKVVDFTELYKGSLEYIKGRLKRRELVIPDCGILLRSHEHSEREREDVYFLIKWSPPKGISLAFALVHEGPMVKNSIKSKRNWKSRYFRLWRRVGANCIYEAPVLQYFKKKGATKPSGELRLCKGSYVKFQNMAVANKKGFGLHLKVCVKMEVGKVPKDLDLFSYTETEDAILQWIKILKQELKLHQKCKPPKSKSSSRRSPKSGKPPPSPKTQEQHPDLSPKEHEDLAQQMRQANMVRQVDEAVDSVFNDAICALGAEFEGGKPIAVELPEGFVYDARVHKGIDYTIGCGGSIRKLLRLVKEGQISLPRETGLLAQSMTMSKRLGRTVYYHMHYDDDMGKDMHEAFRINQLPILNESFGAGSSIGHEPSPMKILNSPVNSSAPRTPPRSPVLGSFLDRSPISSGMNLHARFGSHGSHGSHHSVPVGIPRSSQHVRISSSGSRGSHKSAPAFTSHNPHFDGGVRSHRLNSSSASSHGLTGLHTRFGSDGSHGSAPNFVPNRANPQFNSVPLHSMPNGVVPNPAFRVPASHAMGVPMNYPNTDNEQVNSPIPPVPLYNHNGHHPGNDSARASGHVLGGHPPQHIDPSLAPVPRPHAQPPSNNFGQTPTLGVPCYPPPRVPPPFMGAGVQVDHAPQEQVQSSQI